MMCRVKLAALVLVAGMMTLAGCTTTLRTDFVGFEEEKKPERSVGSYLFGEDKGKVN